jgi:hypothetical protein
MSRRIDEIFKEIRKLEDELRVEFKKKEEEFFYKIQNRKVKFKKEIIEDGKKMIESSLSYLSSFNFLVILTIPFIWAMIIPAIITDIFVTVYQAVCFPIYKIPKVKRSDYIIIDRYNLFYLDKVERLNCLYCEYFNGLLAYVREIAGRTEQFWCPIKHSRPLKDAHSRYYKFFDFGDYKTYRKELKLRRGDFSDIA